MATGTLAPSPWFTGFDDNGDPVASGKLYTYAAGSSTPLATYSDVGLTTANANPVILDSAGRCTLFLLASSYKLVLKSAADATIRSQDNVGAVPATNIDNDVNGTAGEAVTATQLAYLSDGSGSLTSGRWYLADADLDYASLTPQLGLVVTDAASAATGTFRLSGRMTGFSGLSTGSDYYVSATAGGITTTAPANARYVGRADSSTSLIVTPNPGAVRDVGICNGRLTLTTGVPVTTADVTAATTLYFALYKGNRIALYTGSAWKVMTFAQLSIAVPAVANQMYDVWAYDNAGVVALEVLAWTNDTTRATALIAQDGVFVKTGVTTRRYLGSFRTLASGQTEDSANKRLVWNYTNRVLRHMQRIDTTVSWTYTSTTIQQANAAVANQLAVVVGVAETMVEVNLIGVASNTTVARLAWVGIGVNSTTTFSGTLGQFAAPVAAYSESVAAHLTHMPAAGYTFYSWNESNDATGAWTYYGENTSVSNRTECGLSGTVEG